MDRVRTYVVGFLSLFVAMAASADWVGVSGSKAINAADQTIIRHEWTSTATDSTAYDISACLGGVDIRFDASTGDTSTDATFQIRACTSSTTAPYCRPISWPGPSDGATWIGINAPTSGENYILADAMTATAGGDTARVELRCTSAVTRQTSVDTATQPSPSMFTPSMVSSATITTPATAIYGQGVEFGTLTEFADGHSYNGGSTLVAEPDNQGGFSYNKYLNDAPININEHAFDDSWETDYFAAGTNDEPWVEKNWDVYAADWTATVSAVAAFDPADFSYVVSTGGGTCLVIDFTGTTLKCRQIYGVMASGETLSEAASPTHTATLGTQAALTTYQHFRPRLETWQTVTGTASFDFITQYGSAGSTISIKKEKVGIGAAGAALAATLEVHGANECDRNQIGTRDCTGHPTDGYPVFWLQYEGENNPTSGNTHADAMWSRMDFTGLVDAVSLVDYANAIIVKTPLEADTANSVYQAYGLRIEDQRAAGNNHGAAFLIESQDCRSNATCASLTDGWHNNFEFGGGNWSTGHLMFDGGSDISSGHDTSDHIWRDDTNEVFRISTDDAPDSETDGRPIVTGTGITTDGPAIWATSVDGTGDQGDEICTKNGRGLTCQDVIDLTTITIPVDSACATDITTGSKMIVMCY